MIVSNAPNVGTADPLPQGKETPTAPAASGVAVSQPQRLSSLALGLAVSFGLALAVSPAWPQQLQCGSHADVEAKLSAQYGETRRAMGITVNGMVMETFANDATGTWTVTVTGADGNTCLIAAGSDWDDIDSKPGVDG